MGADKRCDVFLFKPDIDYDLDVSSMLLFSGYSTVHSRDARFFTSAAIEVETYQIAVCNGRHYGGGNVVEETAETDDGHLDPHSLE